MKNFFSNPSCIVKVIFIERTSSTQAYAIGVLDLCPHFSLLTVDLTKFLYVLHHFKKSDTLAIFISSRVCYTSEDNSIKVVNGDTNSVPILATIHSRFTEMLKKGLGNKFTLNDFGRGDVLKDVESNLMKPSVNERSIPTISVGFGTQDCNRYSSSRMTIAGNNKPYISNGGLCHELSHEFFHLVKEVLSDYVGKNAFRVADLPEAESKFRRSLQKEFAQYLTGKSLTDDDLRDFRIEGSTGIIGQRVAIHCDTENSKRSQMNNAICLTSNVPMAVLPPTEPGTQAKNFDLRKVLIDRGYDENGSFPFSNILYSKAPIDTQVNKLVALEELKGKNDFNDIMIWVLTERIKHDVDYRGSIIDNDDDFLTLFNKELEKKQSKHVSERKGELINKPYLALVAAYDKTGYWGIVFDFWNTLVANIIPKTNIYHVVQFSLYVGGVCNGTSVPWRLMEEVMENPQKSRKRFTDEFNQNVFDFLKKVDDEVGDDQLKEFHSSNKSGKSKVKRARGSCTQQRYQYQKSSQDITASDTIVSNIVTAINDAYFSMPSKKLKSPGKQRTHEDSNKKKKRSVLKIIEPYDYVLQTIEQNVKGVGHLTSQFVMNCIAGCGGVPLRTYNEASIPEKWTATTGPINILKRALNLPHDIQKLKDDLKNDDSGLSKDERKRIEDIMERTPREYYTSLYKDLKQIFKGGQITMNLLENIGCELWRSFCNTCEKSFDLGKELYETVSIAIIKRSVDRHESLKRDLYFHISHREKPQNLFSIEMGRNGTSNTNPCMFIKLPEMQKMQRLTNWKVSDERKNMIYWNKRSDSAKMNKNVYLKFNDAYKSIFEHPNMKSTMDVGSPMVTISGRQVKPPNFFDRRSSNTFLDDDNDSDYVES